MVKLFALKDIENGTTGPIICDTTERNVIHSLRKEVNNENSNSTIKQFPEDHHLFLIGEYDERDMVIKSLPEPKLIAIASKLLDLNEA